MTSSVTLSAAVRSNLLALDQTSALQATTQQRLATGKKVNSALDNPTNYFTAAALSARAGELTNLLDSMTNGVNTLTAADNGLTSITTTLQSMQATVTQARQDASWQSTSYSLDATSIGTTQLKNLTFAAGAVGTTPVTVALNTLGTGTATTSSAGAQFSAIPGLTSPVTATSNVFSGAVILASTPAQFSFSDADIAAMADNTTFSMQRSDGPFFATATKVASSPNSSLGEFTDGAGLHAVLNTGTISPPYLDATLTYAGGVNTVVCKNVTSNLVVTGATPTTDIAAFQGDALTVSDGTYTATFYKVASGASAADGTYTTLDDLVSAINSSTVGTGSVGAVTASNTGIGNAGSLHLSSTAGLTVGGAAAADLGLTSPPSGVGFTIAVNGGGGHAISVSPSDVAGAGIDASNGGDNSLDLTAAINSKLAAAGIANVQAVKSGTVGVSAATDTISLQATTPGPGTTFTLSGITGGVVGGTVTPGTGVTGSVYTVDQLVSAINGNAALAGAVRASDNAGQLQITNLSTSMLTATGISSSTGLVDGGTGTATVAGNTTRANLVVQFNQLKDQLDKTAQDSSFNGINLLTGDALKLYFNENSTSSLTIQSTNAAGVNSATLGIGTATDSEFQNNALLDARLQSLQGAVTTVASQASAFGSNLAVVQNRQTFTNSMVNTLQTGADGLTMADTNLEGANMLTLQTQQQLSIQSLSLASQAQSAVMRLFG